VIIVTGSITAQDEHVEEVERRSLEHVRRSRGEPGCLLHSVFVEHWADADALRTHFAVPASGEFVVAAAALASEPPVISVFTAEPMEV
jgi:quinol monooxygenase YgiN